MRRPPGAYFDCPRVPSLLVVNCGNCCLMICKSTQESVTHREKLGAQSLRLTNSIQRKGKTYALDCNDLLGVSWDPGEDTSVGTWGGGKQGSDCEVLDSEGVSLGCPALCPAAHNVGGVRGDAECVSPAT